MILCPSTRRWSDNCCPLAGIRVWLMAHRLERANVQISGAGYGMHWPELDEDIGIEGLLVRCRRKVPPRSSDGYSGVKQGKLQETA